MKTVRLMCPIALLGAASLKGYAEALVRQGRLNAPIDLSHVFTNRFITPIRGRRFVCRLAVPVPGDRDG